MIKIFNKVLLIVLGFYLSLLTGLVTAKESLASVPNTPRPSFGGIIQRMNLDRATALRLADVLHEYQNQQREIYAQIQASYQGSAQDLKSSIEALEQQDEILFHKVQGILNPDQVSNFVTLFKEYQQIQRSVDVNIQDGPVSPAFLPAPAYMRVNTSPAAYSGVGLAY